MKTCSNCGKSVSFLAKVGEHCPNCGALWSSEKTHKSARENKGCSIRAVIIVIVIAGVILIPILLNKIKNSKEQEAIVQLLEEIPPVLIKDSKRQFDNSSLILTKEGKVVELRNARFESNHIYNEYEMHMNDKLGYLNSENFMVFFPLTSVLFMVNTTEEDGDYKNIKNYIFDLTYLVNNKTKTVSGHIETSYYQSLLGYSGTDDPNNEIIIDFNDILYLENKPDSVINYVPIPVNRDSILYYVNIKFQNNETLRFGSSRLGGEWNTDNPRCFFLYCDETKKEIPYKNIREIEYLPSEEDDKSDKRIVNITLKDGKEMKGNPYLFANDTQRIMGISSFGWCSVNLKKVKKIVFE